MRLEYMRVWRNWETRDTVAMRIYKFTSLFTAKLSDVILTLFSLGVK